MFPNIYEVTLEIEEVDSQILLYLYQPMLMNCLLSRLTLYKLLGVVKQIFKTKWLNRAKEGRSKKPREEKKKI